MSDAANSDIAHSENAFLEEVDRGRAVTKAVVRASINTDPDAYPFVLELLNEVLLSGIGAQTIGGSEPNTLKRIGSVIKQVLQSDDPPSAGFITIR